MPALVKPLALSEVRPGEIYTPREVASLFKVDRRTVAGWCRTGTLHAGKTPGGDYRVLGGEVLRVWGKMFQEAAAGADDTAHEQQETDAQMEIAARLRVSVKTVETYKARASEKLGLHSRVDLVRHAVRCGWVGEGEPAGGHPSAP